MIVFPQIASMEWCKAPDVGLPAPDLVFLLKLSAEAAEQREEFGRERYERPEFQEEVNRQFEQLRDEKWQVLDASLDIESLHEMIIKATKTVMKKEAKSPIKKLWTEK